ncbi:MAG: N-acetylmuramoyl-L-alanine amidase [Clostridiales bacterium]|nr:N-acetylmuramoyl-L-alanine amidase [Clostridiales bacterium]
MHRKFELFMVVCLLAASFLLARKGAALVAASEGNLSASHDESVTIVIDAGHGGNDPGKVGVNDCLEKDINLTLALGLQTLLENRTYNVIMTRTTDVTLGDPDSGSIKQSDLQKRIEIITEADADFVVSIHQNSYSDSSVSGPQVFYYEGSDEGKVLASYLQESLNSSLNPTSPRNIKGNTDYYILKKSPAPTVIIECGFLSNPEEAELLTSSEYQGKVIRAIYNGIEDYINSKT